MKKPPIPLPSRPAPGVSPDRANPRVPSVSPVRSPVGKRPTPPPEKAKSSEGRDASGRFIPIILSPEAEQERADRADLGKLIKFSDVLDVLGEFDPHPSEPEIVEAMREKLLFQGNPVVRQKLAKYDKQTGVVQAIVGEDMPPSVQRRIGGTGWASQEKLDAAAQALARKSKKGTGRIVLPG